MYWENTSTPVAGWLLRSWRAARTPSSVCVGGIRMSATTTSGWCSATAAISAAPSATAAHTTWPRSSSSLVSPSRSSAASSAITTRIAVPLTLSTQRQLDRHHSRPPGRARHVDLPVHRRHPLRETGQAAPPPLVGAADAVVRYPQPENLLSF